LGRVMTVIVYYPVKNYARAGGWGAEAPISNQSFDLNDTVRMLKKAVS
jgi:hypothetical protein